MEPATLKALKASIAKWERNAKAKKPANYKTGPDDCPLCKLFNSDETDYGSICIGCPVAVKTGRKYCEGSPYDAAFKAWFAWTDHPNRDDQGLGARQAAEAEVAFLKSLLPVSP